MFILFALGRIRSVNDYDVAKNFCKNAIKTVSIVVRTKENSAIFTHWSLLQDLRRIPHNINDKLVTSPLFSNLKDFVSRLYNLKFLANKFIPFLIKDKFFLQFYSKRLAMHKSFFSLKWNHKFWSKTITFYCSNS